MAPTSPRLVVIAGGSGFLGLSLARHLTDAGLPVTILSRSAPPAGPWSHARWDGRTLGDWAGALDGAAALINVAGRSVDCVKTPLHCDQILRSRVESTRVLGEALWRAAAPPPVWVQMSTAHIYGDSELPCDESAALGLGLAPDVGRAWEQAFDDARPARVRGVVLRTSFVLGRHDGPLPKLARLARFGLGGTIGTGRQGMSWIHETDMNRLFAQAIDNDAMQGVYIASSPGPVSNRDFMRSLRRAVRRPVGLPAFAWQVRLAAPLILRTDPELAIYGRYVHPRRLLEEGFAFDFPDLDGALADLLQRAG